MADSIKPNQHSFMSCLPASLRNKIDKLASLIKYSDGQLIQNRGDAKLGLSIVRSGSVNVGIYGADGKFVTIAELGPGESFGEFTILTGLPRTHDITAIGPTEIYQISVKEFQTLYDQGPHIPTALLKATLWRTHLLLETVDAMRRLPVLEQTAKLLFSLHHTSQGENSILCKQSELAFRLGISRVSIGKALKKLSDLGLVELGYGKITLPNPQELETWIDRQCETIQLSSAGRGSF